jgi:dienelactone hydrolase
MAQTYRQLGIFSDWVDEARRQGPLYPEAAPGRETQRLVREALGFCDGPEAPQDVRVEDRWERDGVAGEEVSWSVGYGPRTHVYVLKPVQAQALLRGVVALHDHGMFKFYGKEKIADGPADPPTVLAKHRDTYYGGRAYANALAREGFVVLVPDTFLWGSRGFPLEVMLDQVGDDTAAMLAMFPPTDDTPFEIARYNTAAAFHEHIASKYCNVLGTTMAGLVAHEDRIAVNYLLSRPDVLPNRAGCIGLSGGGNRAALLNATHDRIAAAAIVGLMCTYAGLLDHNISTHTWMLFPFGWARHGDWPDLAACRAPSPLLVQYDLDDELFTPGGMAAAHERLTRIFAAAGAPDAYTGQFYPGPHRFDLAMQAVAFAWLKQWLK